MLIYVFVEALYIRLIIQSIKTKTLHFKKANRIEWPELAATFKMPKA